MPRLNSKLVMYKLNIKEGTKTVKMAPRNFKQELEANRRYNIFWMVS